MPLAYPPTVIVRNARENPRKCSILPLKGRADLIFVGYAPGKPQATNHISLEGYVRLAAEGEPLSERDAGAGILLLDGSWRWAGVMNRDFLDIPARSLQGYRTAYPRRSKLDTDPQNGLASVEALFIAYHILGRPTDGLLDHFRWADEFLRLNNLSG